jgi:hypothetical protein
MLADKLYHVLDLMSTPCLILFYERIGLMEAHLPGNTISAFLLIKQAQTIPYNPAQWDATEIS